MQILIGLILFIFLVAISPAIFIFAQFFILALICYPLIVIQKIFGTESASQQPAKADGSRSTSTQK